ncbi:hypothetical protein HCZ30_04715 [Marivivens donghaensis]|uniref:DUF6473 domain-containing protein n=1 Tax=Marivivens donghaensis TaxID=1699413 RepID=A0ABX0VUK1_9RHOB|nr:DUF6473 family protein [Marivivens donghaensis]NIY71736.1 hypothetical protein [Marivivens donghaensis]
MKHELLPGGGIDYELCHYGHSRLHFRGPKREPSEPYVAFLGGSNTFGRYIDEPFPELLEANTGVACVNLGVVGASVGAFAQDPSVIDVCRGATVTVIEACNFTHLSNRFYRVHPRRNERLIHASDSLRALCPSVDFTEYTFVWQLLRAVEASGPECAEAVQQEIAEAWRARMRSLIDAVGRQVVLLCPSDFAETGSVSGNALESLRPFASSIVEIAPVEVGTRGMIVPDGQGGIAKTLMNAKGHCEAADALEPVMLRLMGQ